MSMKKIYFRQSVRHTSKYQMEGDFRNPTLYDFLEERFSKIFKFKK